MLSANGSHSNNNTSHFVGVVWHSKYLLIWFTSFLTLCAPSLHSVFSSLNHSCSLALIFFIMSREAGKAKSNFTFNVIKQRKMSSPLPSNVFVLPQLWSVWSKAVIGYQSDIRSRFSKSWLWLSFSATVWCSAAATKTPTDEMHYPHLNEWEDWHFRCTTWFGLITA